MAISASSKVCAAGNKTATVHSKTVAVAIGSEFGTVGPEVIREAAKEAVKIADLLVICGFAFDPMAGEEASTLGPLTILQARMNHDLAMGDELLKKTPAQATCSWSSASPTSRSSRPTTGD